MVLLLLRATSFFHILLFVFSCGRNSSVVEGVVAIAFTRGVSSIRTAASSFSSSSTTTRLWVRNIDLPEVLVLYDVLDRGSDWTPLLKQCRACDTQILVISSPSTSLQHTEPTTTIATPTDKHSTTFSENKEKWSNHLDVKDLHSRYNPYITAWHNGTVFPPRPNDLWNYAVQSRMVEQPKPFGGSSGFGAFQHPDPPRRPLSSRVVVIGASESHSLAARYCGMRVIGLLNNNSEPQKDLIVDALADIVLSVDELQNDVWPEDLATPGSFWLNPSHPRDEHGNRVDTEQVIQELDLGVVTMNTDTTTLKDRAVVKEVASSLNEEEELQRILADLSSL